MMKKIFSVIAAAALMLAGCGSSSAETAQSSAASSQSTSVSAAPVQSAESTSDNAEKAIVVYFSGSGNTEGIAQKIAADIGADTFAATPSQPYTADDLRWSDENSRVSKEHEDESLQNVSFETTNIPDWESYTTVFLGYPIWWQDASWVMKSFVKQIDFTGKTVIPFCTSSSSPIGDSADNLQALAGTGDWQESRRFSSTASEDEIQSWLNTIGF